MFGGTDGMKQVVEALESNNWSETLCIDGVGWSRNDERKSIAEEQINAFGRCTCSINLMLHNAEIEDSVDQILSTSLGLKHNLRSLTLCKLSKDNQPYCIPEEAFHSTTMELLNLSNVALDLQSCIGISRMIQTSTSLRKMSLDSVEIDNTGWPLLMDAVKQSSSLKFFKLKRVRVESSITFQALARNTSITNLTLEDVGLGVYEATDLAAMISQNHTVSHLSLQKNAIDAQAMTILSSQGFLHNTTIQTLYLSGNPLGEDDGAVSVAHMLTTGHSLSKLCLAVTCISHKGGVVIAKALSSNRGLRSISLDGNDIGSCAHEFLRCMQRNRTLHTITGQRSSRKDQKNPIIWKQVDILLRANKAGRVALANNDLRVNSIPFLLERCSEQSDVLFHFVTETVGVFTADDVVQVHRLKTPRQEPRSKQLLESHTENSSVKRLPAAVDQRPVCPPSA